MIHYYSFVSLIAVQPAAHAAARAGRRRRGAGPGSRRRGGPAAARRPAQTEETNTSSEHGDLQIDSMKATLHKQNRDRRQKERTKNEAFAFPDAGARRGGRAAAAGSGRAHPTAGTFSITF